MVVLEFGAAGIEQSSVEIKRAATTEVPRDRIPSEVRGAAGPRVAGCPIGGRN